MRLCIVLLALISLSAATIAHAQQPQQDWIPSGIQALGHNASSRTEFTLDHSMLVFASKMDQDNEDLRHVIAGVNGVSVHSYRFPGSWLYDASALGIVRDQYHRAGWKHMVSNHKDDGSINTDLWIRFDDGAISNIAVLLAGEKQLNFIAVSGSISPLDLLHLSGHFGIPKIGGGPVVPAPDSGR